MDHFHGTHHTKKYRDMQHFPMKRFRVDHKHYHKARFKKQMLRFYERQ